MPTLLSRRQYTVVVTSMPVSQREPGPGSQTLTRDDATRRLTSAAAQIVGLGVRRLALFGSVLRNEARPDSDVDILVEFDPARKTFDSFLALSDRLERVLDRPIELVTTESLSPYIGPHIIAEAQDVVRAA